VGILDRQHTVLPDHGRPIDGASKLEQALQKAGVVGPLPTTVSPPQAPLSIGQAFVQSHVGAFYTLDKQQPGMWSLSAGVNSVSFPETDLEASKGILFRFIIAFRCRTRMSHLRTF
jgi:hypothetical protein